jgi:hypothetical protein
VSVGDLFYSTTKMYFIIVPDKMYFIIVPDIPIADHDDDDDDDVRSGGVKKKMEVVGP